MPRELISRMPLFGRWVARPALPPAEPPSVTARIAGLPTQALNLLKAPLRGPQKTDKSAEKRRHAVGLVHAMRRPLEQTARVVQAAREARRPKTRWERLREAASQAANDPAGAIRWERLMGLGIALARPAKQAAAVAPDKQGRLRGIRSWRAASPPVAVPSQKPAGLRKRLLSAVRGGSTAAKQGKKEDGAGKSRGRPLGSRRRPS